MAIEQVTGRVPPAAALRAEIARRRNTPAVMLSGLGPVLDVLDAFIAAGETEKDDMRERLEGLEAQCDERNGTGHARHCRCSECRE